jgi:hypothetical protein
MAGHHVLDIAELLVPGEGGKWGTGGVVRRAQREQREYVLAADEDEVQL